MKFLNAIFSAVSMTNKMLFIALSKIWAKRRTTLRDTIEVSEAVLFVVIGLINPLLQQVA